MLHWGDPREKSALFNKQGVTDGVIPCECASEGAGVWITLQSQNPSERVWKRGWMCMHIVEVQDKQCSWLREKCLILVVGYEKAFKKDHNFLIVN